MLDLNHLRLFIEIVKVGSFAGTARRLGVPTNTVTRHIQQLEAAAHMRLMHRSTRKLTLTPAGQALYERCVASVEELSNAAQEIIDDSQTPGGLVRVAAAAGFFDVFGMKHIVEFLALYPRIRVEFLLDDARTDLIAESIDVALRSGRQLKSSSVARRVIETPSVLAASPSYLANNGAPAYPQALAKHQCVVLARDSARTNWTLEGPSGRIEVTVSGRFRANNARTVMQATAAGLGIALLPYSAVRRRARSWTSRRVLAEYRAGTASMYAVFPNRKQSPAQCRYLLTSLSRKCG